ncbi:unnamed protein product [Chrysoparadoxa australica]
MLILVRVTDNLGSASYQSMTISSTIDPALGSADLLGAISGLNVATDSEAAYNTLTAIAEASSALADEAEVTDAIMATVNELSQNLDSR